MTNGEKLRAELQAMSDEELLRNLYRPGVECPPGIVIDEETFDCPNEHGDCNECWLAWLKAPAEGDGV